MDRQAPIKEAFSRAKQDIQSLKDSFSTMMRDLADIKRTLQEISSQKSDRQTNQQTDYTQNQTNNPQSDSLYEPPTEDWPYKRLKPHIYRLSTRNGGVPTDRQTNQQTDRQTHKNTQIDNLERVSEILASLDSMKKDLRSKFKHLTQQEMLVFSTIYQLEEEKITVDYPTIAKKLSLSESSIRDYILKLAKKGIPIEKIKENNKKIYLKISEDFKRLASLQTILELRDL